MDFALTAGESKASWGAVTKDNKTGGRWTPSELNINALELKAVKFGLKVIVQIKIRCSHPFEN